MAEAELETTLLLGIRSIVAKGTQNGEYSIAVSTLVRPEPLAAAIVPVLPGADGPSPARVCYLSDSLQARIHVVASNTATRRWLMWKVPET